ncbi:MAG: peptidyl-prolyl cis-trans isomerase [Candidatus Riflebacteria bacterium]|nr:peptidyl-prolyl cis-trans isomerase [Candidatus Riflebacteria bacterium]
MNAKIRRGSAYFFFFGFLLTIAGILSAQNTEQPVAQVSEPAKNSEAVKTTEAAKAPEAAKASENTLDIFAEVGDIKLTKEVFDKELETMGPGEKTQFSTKEGKKQFVKQWIDVTLLEKEAEKLGLANKEEKQKTVHDWTLNIIAQRFLMKKLENSKITDEEIKDYYQKNIQNFNEPETYHLFQITVKDLADVEKIKADLASGKTFLETAKKYSSDSFAPNGGDRSFVKLSELPKTCEEPLKALKKDQISDPIKAEDGQTLILKYTEKTEGKAREMTEVTNEIKKSLAEKNQDKVLDELKKEVEFKLDEKASETLKKETFSPEDLEKNLFTIGSKTFKISEIAEELERIPPMFRVQLMDDFIKQVSLKEIVRSYSEKHLDELKKEFPESEADAKKRVGIRTLLDEKIGSQIKITDEEIKDYYTKNLTTFNKPAQTRARHILVDDEAKAKDLLARTATEPFEELAKANSKCPSSKEGGDLGFFATGQMVPEFDEAAQSAEIGKVVGPIKTKFGYHLIKVIERKPAGTVPLEEVKDKIRSKLMPERQKAAFDTYLADLRKQYPVKDFSDKI